MKKRLLSILLVLVMALSVLPTAAFAEDGGENLPACICETACTAEEMNIDCPVCGAEGAQPENCALYAQAPDADDPAPEDEDDEAFEECGVDKAFYANRRRSYEEVMPWSHLDYLVSRRFFIRENKKAHMAQTTRNCCEGCSGCGITKEYGGVYCGAAKKSEPAN